MAYGCGRLFFQRVPRLTIDDARRVERVVLLKRDDGVARSLVKLAADSDIVARVFELLLKDSDVVAKCANLENRCGESDGRQGEAKNQSYQ